MIPTMEHTKERAYEIWEHEGRPAGRDIEHWVKASRDLYREQISERLESGLGKLRELRERATDQVADAKADAEKALDTLERNATVLRDRVNALGNAAPGAWDELREGVEKAWGDFTAGIEKSTKVMTKAANGTAPKRPRRKAAATKKAAPKKAAPAAKKPASTTRKKASKATAKRSA